MAINNTWKKQGREGGGERKRRDLGFGVFGGVLLLLLFLLTLHKAENPHSTHSPSTSHGGKMQPHITIPTLHLGVSPSLGCPNPQEGPNCN